MLVVRTPLGRNGCEGIADRFGAVVADGDDGYGRHSLTFAAFGSILTLDGANYHVAEYLTRPNLRGHDKYLLACGEQIDYRMRFDLGIRCL
jgi:hypothetical protein